MSTKPSGSRAAMLLHVNGTPREFADGLTVAELLELLDVRGRGVAVERNLEVVPRAAHPSTTLTEGDRVEVVTLVGGG